MLKKRRSDKKIFFYQRLGEKIYCSFYIDIPLLFMFFGALSALFSAKCTDKIRLAE